MLGTFVEVTADREEAIEEAFRTIERVHRLMSAHEPDSDVSRINRSAHETPVELDPWTRAVLERAQFWSARSLGAFDVVRAGKLAVETGYLPRHADQPAPLACGWTELELGKKGARLARPGCIDLGGIAKGFAVDRAIAALKSCGARYGLVNAGGDLRAFGREWAATLVEPRERRAIATLSVEDQSIATSALQPGTAADHLPWRGERYVSATVRAAGCMDADALAKVLISGAAQACHCLSLVGGKGLMVTDRGLVEALEPVAA